MNEKKFELLDRKILFGAIYYNKKNVNGTNDENNENNVNNENNMSIIPIKDQVDMMVALYMQNKPNMYYIVLWPCVQSACDMLIRRLSCYGVPIYVKHLDLSYDNIKKFICLLYYDHPNNIVCKIIEHKTKYLDKKKLHRISFIIFNNFLNVDISGSCAPFKMKLRKYISECASYKGNINNVLHINDTDKQTECYSKYLLNDRLFENFCNC